MLCLGCDPADSLHVSWSKQGAGGKVPWGLETGTVWGAEPSIRSNPARTGVSACCLTPASWEGLSLKAGGAKASVPAPVLSQPLAHTEPQLSSEKGSAARGSLSPCHPCPCPRAVPARHRREKLAAPAAAGSGPVTALPRATGASLVHGDAGKSWKCFTCATATSETASEFKRLGFPGSLCPLEDTSTFCCVLSLRQKSHFKSCFLFFSAF